MTPAAAPDQDQVIDAVRLACRAPSIHNSQPWRWETSTAALHLFARRGNPLPVTDPTRREMLVSVGAVLGHLQMVMAGFGWYCHITLLPDPNHPDHIAEIVFTPASIITDGHLRRVEAIAVRRTDRLAMTPPTGWTRFYRDLASRLVASGTQIDLVDDSSRPALDDASALAASARAYDSPYHAELAWWSHRTQSSADGIQDSALLTVAEGRRVGLARDFPAVSNSRHDMGVAIDDAKVVVLSTISDEPQDVVRCGITLSTVLIEATCAGLATCTVSHVTEIAQSRAMVASLTAGDSLPQVLVRIGKSSDRSFRPPTPRRSIDDVLSVTPSTQHERSSA